MTVFVTHMMSDRDYSPAHSYGRLVPVFPSAPFPMDGSHKFHIMTNEARLILDKFNAADDYLLLSGAPETIAACAAILSRRCRFFNMLKWDREIKTYYSIVCIP